MRHARACRALFFVVAFAAGAVPVRASDAVATLRTYLQAVSSADYARAYASLDTPSRRYYGSERNYASWFRALHVRLRSYKISPVAGGLEAQEQLRLFDPALGRDAAGVQRVRYALTRERGAVLVRDLEHPRQAFAPSAQATVDGACVVVDDVELYRSHVAIRLTLRKTDAGFATFLPYNKTVLTDQDERVYPLLVSHDWRVTDKTLFLGMRLAGNAQYTGTMRFRIPGGATPRVLHLEVAPVVRDGGRLAPFGVPLPPIEVALP